MKAVTFGDQLKEARQARGVSLEAVAEATRIALQNLAALEQSDLEGLPRGPFGKGYIRAYAQFLGIDPKPILEAYHSVERQRGLGPSATRNRTLDELSQLVEKRSATQPRARLSPRLAWGSLAFVTLAILGTGGWLLIGEDPPEAGAPVSVPAAPPRPRPATTGTTREAMEARPAPESTPSERAVDASSVGLHVSESGMGTGVQNSQLVDRADRFVEGTLVWFWTRALGGEPDDVIEHVWMHEDREVMRAELRLGGFHWRTHSRLALPEGATGRWVAEARSPDGRVLAREEFLCVSEEPRPGQSPASATSPTPRENEPSRQESDTPTPP